MFLGMGTVFLFLIIMIFVVYLMSFIIHRFFPEPQSNEELSAGTAGKDNRKVVAAITAAIKHHRQG